MGVMEKRSESIAHGIICGMGSGEKQKRNGGSARGVAKQCE